MLVRAPPQQQKGIRSSFRLFWNGVIKMFVRRIKPYPPIFRRIAARIIDPATGASTCAFGSHK